MSTETVIQPQPIASASDALRLVLKASEAKTSQLPCRVDEMTPRELEIFKVVSELAGNALFITDVARRGLAAEDAIEIEASIPRSAIETLLSKLEGFEPDNSNLVGVNDFSVGHESGQNEAAESIARMVSEILEDHPRSTNAASDQSTAPSSEL